MTLRVFIPPTHEAARRYVIAVLLGEHLGLDYRIEMGGPGCLDTRIRGDDGSGPELRIRDGLFLVPESGLPGPGCKPDSPLSSVPTWQLQEFDHPSTEPLPVIFGAPLDSAGNYFQSHSGAIEFGLDVLGGAFYLLARLEEHFLPDRDAHGRFPADAALSCAEGFHHRPIVDEYAELLWSALVRLWPRLTRRSGEYRVFLTHDVDQPLANLGKGAVALARSVGADVVLRRAPGLAIRRAAAWATLRISGRHRADPAFTFDFLMDTSERLGLRSAFYFITRRTAGILDGDYDMDMPWVGPLLREIHARGHEIGLHASYRSSEDAKQLVRERDALSAALDRNGVPASPFGGRHHYLRWRAQSSWVDWDRAGLSYDSSLGFSGKIGFRSGTCRPHTVFDVVGRKHLKLVERPLAAMETGLISRNGRWPRAKIDLLHKVAGTVRRFRGELVLLWHNDNLMLASQRRVYRELLEAVT